MGKRSTRSKACEFGAQARQEIYFRDSGNCIFCSGGFPFPEDWFERQIDGVMHYIPRSRGGLGIAKNGALGCHYHHRMLDNGADTWMRDKMKEYFREYLERHYPGWNEEDLIYDKRRGV